MKIQTLIYDKTWQTVDDNQLNKTKVDIVFLFASRKALEDEKRVLEIQELFPNANIVGSSSSGNVLDAELSQYELVATAISFDKGCTKISSLEFNENDDVEELSKNLISNLPKENLKHIFIMCDGLLINGSELIRGINKINPNISISGGTAADGEAFEKTFVIANDIAKQRCVVAIGFYGDSLHISSAAFSGWTEFGAHRLITKSVGNTVYEIDHEPALDLYKKYLGEEAKYLPGSALKFPISIQEKRSKQEVIRTVIAVNPEDKSISFAGDVPEDCIVRFMKGEMDKLVEGAKNAALEVEQYNNKEALGLVVSCTGRLNVMNQLIEEELDALEEVLGEKVKLRGFYSYGEIGTCQGDIKPYHFHNQTMTLTTIYEE